MTFAEGGDERCSRGLLGFLAEVVAEVVAVAAVPDAVAVVGRVVWAAPKRPGQAATACAPVAVTKCLIKWDSHATR
ncbi:MAG: hypothetical protein H8E90_05470 [Anaerolineales bacterium]|nr:hypothetical protein [Anaerolineales bacterium]